MMKSNKKEEKTRRVSIAREQSLFNSSEFWDWVLLEPSDMETYLICHEAVSKLWPEFNGRVTGLTLEVSDTKHPGSVLVKEDPDRLLSDWRICNPRTVICEDISDRPVELYDDLADILLEIGLPAWVRVFDPADSK